MLGGGFKYALIDSANPTGQITNGWYAFGKIPVREAGEAVTSTHSVDSSDQTIWGNGEVSPTIDYGSTTQLSCGSCHDPHGNGNYRILQSVPLDSGGSAVDVPDTDDHVYTTDNYWPTENYWPVEGYPDYLYRYYAWGWCSACHTRTVETYGGWDTHDAVYRYRHRSAWGEPGLPNCIQCHVAHGSNASMSGEASRVNWPDGTPAGTDSRLLRIDNRGICQMCHNR